MTRRRLLNGLVAAALTVAIAGCAGPVGMSPPTETPDSTASPAPTGAPAPLEELVVRADGVGPLTVGEPVAGDSEETALVRWDPEHCAEVGPNLGPGSGAGEDDGRWVANYPDSEGFWGVEAPFRIEVEDELVSWIDVLSPELTTSEGIGIGSAREELLAAYSEELEFAERGPLTEVHYLRDGASILVFEVSDESDYYPEESQRGVVALIRILEWSGVEPTALMATDAIAGSCYTP